MFLSVLLLLAASSYVECAVELTQDTSVMLKPGDSLTLSCKVSGYSVTDNSYATEVCFVLRRVCGASITDSNIHFNNLHNGIGVVLMMD
ncbi:hypothetical protein QTP86_015415 [Hemibagrus guttatus]|nr:hypothetical protein QTP86_015415 [Hemibagrus guttatus]